MTTPPGAQTYLALLAAELATWRLDCVSETAYLSRLWSEWVGLPLSQGEEVALSFAEWRSRVHPSDWPRVRRGLVALLKGEIQRYRARYRLAADSAAGQWVWIEDRGQVTERDPLTGRAVTAIGICRNVTEEMAHQVEAERLSEAMQHVPVAVVMTQGDGSLLWGNAAAEGLFGCQMIGGSIESVVPITDVAQSDERPVAGKAVVRYTDRGGEIRYLEVEQTAFVSQVTAERYSIYTFHDITERVALEQQLRHLALTDPLTGIPNRRAFLERANALFARVQRAEGKERAVLALIDLDWCKRINDTLGHAAGDAVLRHFGRLLHQLYRTMDSVGRLGGEEFGVMLPLLHAGDAPWRPFERLLEEVRRASVPFNGSVIKFTCSIGVTEVSRSDPTLDHLFARADQALYQAKVEGHNRLVWLAPEGE